MGAYRIVIDVEEGGSIEFGWWVEHRLLEVGCEFEGLSYRAGKKYLCELSESLESDGWFLLYEGNGRRQSFCSDGVWVSLEVEEVELV